MYIGISASVFSTYIDFLTKFFYNSIMKGGFEYEKKS